MIPWLGSACHAWPFLIRWLAYTSAWTVWTLAAEWATESFQIALRYLGLMSKERERLPSMGRAALHLGNLMGWISQNAGVSFVLALYNPTPSSWTFASDLSSLWRYYIPLVLFQLVVLFCWDFHFYHVHRYFHMNKWLYQYVHKLHHKPVAIMSVATSGFLDPLEALLGGGTVATIVTYISCFWLHSYWFYALTVHSMWILQIMGHSGAQLHPNSTAGWAHLLLTPTFVTQAMLGNTQRAMDHATHHHSPRHNFGLYTTAWDDHYRTAKPAVPPHPAALMALDAAYYLLLLLWAHTALSHLLPFVTLAVVWYALPPATQALLMSPLSSWVPRLGIWDKIRAAYRISYAPAGTPGAFMADPQQCYIFCYHPQNIIARGAWYTFAGVGKDGPIATLPRCRLAVGRLMMLAPLCSQGIRAYGCCSSSWRELCQLLRNRTVPTSVAITPDGFSQAKHAGTYSLVLNKRRGFVRLAHETRALLVPVLGLGEPDCVAGGYSPWSLIPKALTPGRATDIKVVFGRPIAVLPGESVEATHKRYVDELLALGKSHGVLLNIVE